MNSNIEMSLSIAMKQFLANSKIKEPTQYLTDLVVPK